MRSNFIRVAVLAVLIIGAIVYTTVSTRPKDTRAAAEEALEKNRRPRGPSKSTRRMDLAKAEEREGVMYGEDDKPFTGTLEKEHPNGERSARIPMKNGVVDGVMKTFDENGTLRSKSIYENGTLVSKQEWDKFGMEIGNATGDPYKLVAGDNGGQTAPVVGLRPTPLLDAVSPSEGIELGQLQERGGVAYRAGTRDPYTGRALRRFSDGSEWERNYQDGKRHGEFKYYYSNGQVQSRENYINGKKDGLYTMYYESGQKRYEAEIVDGAQIGIATSWDQQGRVISKFEHTEDGKRINLMGAPSPLHSPEPETVPTDEDSRS